MNIRKVYSYTPRSGSRVLASCAKSDVAICLVQSGTVAVGDLVTISIDTASPGAWYRADAQRLARQLIPHTGGIAEDVCGTVSFHVPRHKVKLVVESIRRFLNVELLPTDWESLWKEKVVYIDGFYAGGNPIYEFEDDVSDQHVIYGSNEYLKREVWEETHDEEGRSYRVNTGKTETVQALCFWLQPADSEERSAYMYVTDKGRPVTGEIVDVNDQSSILFDSSFALHPRGVHNIIVTVPAEHAKTDYRYWLMRLPPVESEELICRTDADHKLPDYCQSVYCSEDGSITVTYDRDAHDRPKPVELSGLLRELAENLVKHGIPATFDINSSAELIFCRGVTSLPAKRVVRWLDFQMPERRQYLDNLTLLPYGGTDPCTDCGETIQPSEPRWYVPNGYCFRCLDCLTIEMVEDTEKVCATGEAITA